MDLERIKAKLSTTYDVFINNEAYQQIKDNDAQLKAMFLGEADKLFESPYEMSGTLGVYSYYVRGKKIIEFNLNEAPEFNEKTRTIEWFSQHVFKARENLNK